MNYFIVIAGVILVIAVYFLYVYLTNENLSSGILDLKTPKTVDAKQLKSPGSTIFSYQFWVFMAEPASSEKPIIKRTDGGNNINFNITLTGSVLKIKDGSTPLFTATNNFPIQQWTCVVVNYNASNKIAECYINGKLVYTQQLTTPMTVTPSYGLTIGDAALKGYITKVVYLPETLTSDKVWSNYLSGNGQLSISSYFAGYNLNMSIAKDDVVQRNWKLFS
jgi:hypothetical protein